MLTKIDDILLKFFEKIAKDFNWLTGKDNFFLAFVAVLVYFCFFCLCLGEKRGFNDLPSSIFSVFMATFSATLYSWVVLMERSTAIQEQIEGAKNLAHHYSIKSLRLFFLFVFVLSLALASQYKWGKWGTLSIMAIIALLYLVSIDRPSFKRSQAWQKLKEFFAGLLLKPQPVLAPVPKN